MTLEGWQDFLEEYPWIRDYERKRDTYAINNFQRYIVNMGVEIFLYGLETGHRDHYFQKASPAKVA